MAKKAAAKAAPAEVEVVDKPGLGIDDGIVLATTIVLILALVLVHFANQVYTAV